MSEQHAFDADKSIGALMENQYYKGNMDSNKGTHEREARTSPTSKDGSSNGGRRSSDGGGTPPFNRTRSFKTKQLVRSQAIRESQSPPRMPSPRPGGSSDSSERSKILPSVKKKSASVDLDYRMPPDNYSEQYYPKNADSKSNIQTGANLKDSFKTSGVTSDTTDLNVCSLPIVKNKKKIDNSDCIEASERVDDDKKCKEDEDVARNHDDSGPANIKMKANNNNNSKRTNMNVSSLKCQNLDAEENLCRPSNDNKCFSIDDNYKTNTQTSQNAQQITTKNSGEAQVSFKSGSKKMSLRALKNTAFSQSRESISPGRNIQYYEESKGTRGCDKSPTNRNKVEFQQVEIQVTSGDCDPSNAQYFNRSRQSGRDNSTKNEDYSNQNQRSMENPVKNNTRSKRCDCGIGRSLELDEDEEENIYDEMKERSTGGRRAACPSKQDSGVCCWDSCNSCGEISPEVNTSYSDVEEDFGKMRRQRHLSEHDNQYNQSTDCCRCQDKPDRWAGRRSGSTLTVQRANSGGNPRLLRKQSSGGSIDSGQHSICSPFLSRDNSTEMANLAAAWEHVDLGRFIKETLNKTHKDRMSLLKIEQEMVALVKDPTRRELRIPAASSYGRLLVHRCAELFGLRHGIDHMLRNVVSISKAPPGSGAVCRIPSICPFSQWCINKFPSSPINFCEQIPQAKSILKRDAHSLDEEALAMPQTARHSQPPRSKSFEQREEEYERVRRRIFNSSGLHENEWEWEHNSGNGRDGDHTDMEGRDSRLLAPNGNRPHGRLTKVKSLEHRDGYSTGNPMRGQVSKAHSFGGYGGGLQRGDSITSNHSAPPQRILSRQGELASSNWRLSPGNSSGYKTLSVRSESVTPSPTPTTNNNNNGSEGMSNDSSGTNSAGVLWAITDISTVPAGALIIHPQTGQPLTNPDGSLYRYNPAKPPNMALMQPPQQFNLEGVRVLSNPERRRSRLEKQKATLSPGNETDSNGSDKSKTVGQDDGQADKNQTKKENIPKSSEQKDIVNVPQAKSDENIEGCLCQGCKQMETNIPVQTCNSNSSMSSNMEMDLNEGDCGDPGSEANQQMSPHQQNADRNMLSSQIELKSQATSPDRSPIGANGTDSSTIRNEGSIDSAASNANSNEMKKDTKQEVIENVQSKIGSNIEIENASMIPTEPSHYENREGLGGHKLEEEYDCQKDCQECIEARNISNFYTNQGQAVLEARIEPVRPNFTYDQRVMEERRGDFMISSYTEVHGSTYFGNVPQDNVAPQFYEQEYEENNPEMQGFGPQPQVTAPPQILYGAPPPPEALDYPPPAHNEVMYPTVVMRPSAYRIQEHEMQQPQYQMMLPVSENQPQPAVGVVAAPHIGYQVQGAPGWGCWPPMAVYGPHPLATQEARAHKLLPAQHHGAYMPQLPEAAGINPGQPLPGQITQAHYYQPNILQSQPINYYGFNPQPSPIIHHQIPVQVPYQQMYHQYVTSAAVNANLNPRSSSVVSQDSCTTPVQQNFPTLTNVEQQTFKNQQAMNQSFEGQNSYSQKVRNAANRSPKNTFSRQNSNSNPNSTRNTPGLMNSNNQAINQNAPAIFGNYEGNFYVQNPNFNVYGGAVYQNPTQDYQNNQGGYENTQLGILGKHPSQDMYPNFHILNNFVRMHNANADTSHETCRGSPKNSAINDGIVKRDDETIKQHKNSEENKGSLAYNRKSHIDVTPEIASSKAVPVTSAESVVHNYPYSMDQKTSPKLKDKRRAFKNSSSTLSRQDSFDHGTAEPTTERLVSIQQNLDAKRILVEALSANLKNGQKDASLEIRKNEHVYQQAVEIQEVTDLAAKSNLSNEAKTFVPKIQSGEIKQESKEECKNEDKKTAEVVKSVTRNIKGLSIEIQGQNNYNLATKDPETTSFGNAAADLKEPIYNTGILSSVQPNISAVRCDLKEEILNKIKEHTRAASATNNAAKDQEAHAPPKSIGEVKNSSWSKQHNYSKDHRNYNNFPKNLNRNYNRSNSAQHDRYYGNHRSQNRDSRGGESGVYIRRQQSYEPARSPIHATPPPSLPLTSPPPVWNHPRMSASPTTPVVQRRSTQSSATGSPLPTTFTVPNLSQPPPVQFPLHNRPAPPYNSSPLGAAGVTSIAGKEPACAVKAAVIEAACLVQQQRQGLLYRPAYLFRQVPSWLRRGPTPQVFGPSVPLTPQPRVRGPRPHSYQPQYHFYR